MINNLSILTSNFNNSPSLASAMEERDISPASKINRIDTKAPTLIKEQPLDIIPRPNYTNAMSRLNYLKQVGHKHGPMMQGRGDTILNVNEIPRGGKDTAKNISMMAAKKYGIDPALLYASAMEEGMSGLFKSGATGLDTKNRKPTDFGYQDYYGDKQYPINGGQSFGFVTMADQIPDLIKQGYLPKGFETNLRGNKNAGEFSANNFKDVESAMMAKAALIKKNYDEIDEYAKQYGMKLSPKARDFFAMASYNGGGGKTIAKKMQQYANAGLLKDDKFISQRPQLEERVKGAFNDVWGHVAPRFSMVNALKAEKYFD